jgi:hypothetical protein
MLFGKHIKKLIGLYGSQLSRCRRALLFSRPSGEGRKQEGKGKHGAEHSAKGTTEKRSVPDFHQFLLDILGWTEAFSLRTFLALLKIVENANLKL